MGKRSTLAGFAVVLPAVLAFVAGAACGRDFAEATEEDASVDRLVAAPRVTGSIEDGGIDAPPPVVGPVDASCAVAIDAPPVVAGTHVQEGTPIAYATNPPSSGPHYPIWAHFEEYPYPVDDGYLVHSMEHGGVLLLYKCEPAECASRAAELRAVRDAIPTDPSCDPDTRVRVILAPRPALDVPVAAAAWGFTYKADCVDAPSITQFVMDHYAKAPENTCAPGKPF